MNILLLEDEEAIRGFVRINLKRNGMNVKDAENGERALELAEKEGPFDIALLDVMLPTISGFEVCKQLRERFPQIGIIMLTAKGQEEDKIHGLEVGADDYVQKPFSPGELVARIKSLLRRMQAIPEAAKDLHDTATDLWRGPFRLAVQERKLFKNNQEIILTPTEWMMTKMLMERVGEGVSRDDILTEVWGRYYVGDLKVVDVNIRRIRKKLETNASEPEFIETIWGYGYRWKKGQDR